MIELPESATIAAQINQAFLGKTVETVYVDTTPHKFAFFSRDPALYPPLFQGKSLTGAKAVAGYIELSFGGIRLILGENLSIRHLKPDSDLPKKYQLVFAFEDRAFLSITVLLYGALWAVEKGDPISPYFQIAQDKPHPLSQEFNQPYFEFLLKESKPSLSAKAFLATEQRIPGFGNGVLQDILFFSKIHPKTPLNQLTDKALELLYHNIKTILFNMTSQGGRDTEKDIYNRPGEYKTLLSKNTYRKPCPVCANPIEKQSYLGGTVYFCSRCQMR